MGETTNIRKMLKENEKLLKQKHKNFQEMIVYVEKKYTMPFLNYAMQNLTYDFELLGEDGVQEMVETMRDEKEIYNYFMTCIGSQLGIRKKEGYNYNEEFLKQGIEQFAEAYKNTRASELKSNLEKMYIFITASAVIRALAKNMQNYVVDMVEECSSLVF